MSPHWVLTVLLATKIGLRPVGAEMLAVAGRISRGWGP